MSADAFWEKELSLVEKFYMTTPGQPEVEVIILKDMNTPDDPRWMVEIKSSWKICYPWKSSVISRFEYQTK